MSPTPDDYKCFIFGGSFLLIYVAQSFFGGRLLVTWLRFLARFYHLYASLYRTTCFTLALFFYLVASDISSMIKARVFSNILSPRAFARVPATPNPNQEPSSVNPQLSSWMNDDTEDAWKQKIKSSDAKLRQSQHAKAAFWASPDEYSSLSDVWNDTTLSGQTHDVSSGCVLEQLRSLG